MKRKERPPQPYLDLLQEYRREEKKNKLVDPLDQEDTPPPAQPPGQIALAESSSEDEWDEVELQGDVDFNDVQISFAQPEKSRKKLVPRGHKLQVHASCLALLFAHTRARNFWTQDRELWRELRSMMPSVILQQIVPAQHLSPTLKTKTLLEGLRQAANWWNKKFKVANVGLYMVSWDMFKNKERPVEGPVTKEQFIEHLVAARGSLDILGQGFCAMLRAHGFECRLVCSLQPPDFMAHGSAKKTGQKASVYPIYWTEVWDRWESQWISVDPVTGTAEIIRRGGGAAPLEPPQNDAFNMLRYCIAWFPNGTARDVTRRYSSRYAARVRKKRMDNVRGYAKLYNLLLARFAVRELAPRDLKEIKDLWRREQSEGIPSRVADFVGHPLYCLEHQLKKTEILEPKIPIGTLALKGEVIPIYSRKNVKPCRSAQTWYREGRVLAPGAQPKKHRSKRDKLSGVEERVPLYTWEQTEWFRPNPVVDGVVPKSEYRTIDLFTPTMLPAGAAHLKHPLAQRAAKFLAVDYANAAVAVEFKNREGPKSRYSGIVVAKECVEAVLEVVAGLEKQTRLEKKRQHKAKMLYLWKQFMVAAQIRRRVDGNDLGFQITDNEPWPIVSGVIESDVSESESESESEAGPEVAPVAAEAQPEPRPEAAPTKNIPVPLEEVMHNPAAYKKSPTHSDFEDDEEYPDMMLDGLNESDFDV